MVGSISTLTCGFLILSVSNLMYYFNYIDIDSYNSSTNVYPY
jgi:hypothetical protein